MPVSLSHRAGRWRLVEPGGRVARNRAGASMDGGGHATRVEARAQLQAVNRSKSADVTLRVTDEVVVVLTAKQDFSHSVVLSVRAPEHVRDQLSRVLPFDPPDDLHATLLFWPDVEDLQADVLAAALDLVLRSLPSTTATVTGWGDFQASGVSVALLSMPEAERYRSFARSVSEPSETRFGLQPHLTLSQERVDVVELPEISWDVVELEVVQGDRVLRTITLRGHPGGFSTRDQVISRFGEGRLEALLDAVVRYLEFANSGHDIDSALSVLAAGSDILASVQDRAIARPIFRGVTVDDHHHLSQSNVGDTVTYTSRFDTSGWSFDETIARSFTHRRWRAAILATGTVGLVMRLDDVDPRRVLLVPPGQTAPWFEVELQSRLSVKGVGDRSREQEVLMRGRVFTTTVVSKRDVTPVDS